MTLLRRHTHKNGPDQALTLLLLDQDMIMRISEQRDLIFARRTLIKNSDCHNRAS